MGCWWSPGYHLKSDLAKFNPHVLNMEVGKNQNLSYIFGYLLKLIIKILVIGRIFFSKSGEFRPFATSH